jgi:hypothetical protein
MYACSVSVEVVKLVINNNAVDVTLPWVISFKVFVSAAELTLSFWEGGAMIAITVGY